MLKNTIASLLFLLIFGLNNYTYGEKKVAYFNGQTPIFLEQGVVHSAKIDFGKTFSAISSLCFELHFDNDVLDPGEAFKISLLNGTRYFGWENALTSPYSTRTVCLSPAGTTVALFLDGYESFDVRMTQGGKLNTHLR